MTQDQGISRGEGDLERAFGKPTHARVNLRGWRDGSAVSTSVRIGSDPADVIDMLESIDLQVAWGRSRRIVSIDGDASRLSLAWSFALHWATCAMRLTILLPWTLREVALIKRHWNSQRAALRTATLTRGSTDER
jgi:hypothetical protein